MLDIDEYKAINDTYGHPVGDAVLQAASDVLRSVVRVFDFCARYGGDEFAVVMPNTREPNENVPWQRYVVSIADVEALTGYRFFDHVPAEILNVLKKKVDGR